MEVVDLDAAYDRYSLQRRLEEELVFARSVCTDMLEIIHKPVENWDADRLLGLNDRMRAASALTTGYTWALMDVLDGKGVADGNDME